MLHSEASNSRVAAHPADEPGGLRCEQVGEQGLRVDAVHFCRDDQAVHGRGASSATIGSAEEPGFSAKSDTSQASFGGIVGQTHTSVLEEQREARPSLQDVIERLGQVVAPGELSELFAHINLKILDQGTA